MLSMEQLISHFSSVLFYVFFQQFNIENYTKTIQNLQKEHVFYQRKVRTAAVPHIKILNFISFLVIFF